MISFMLAVALHINAFPEAQTVNTEGTITYWVVEFAGQDCLGNIHRMREDVVMREEATEFDVIPIGTKQFMDKVTDRDAYVMGFLSAMEACNGKQPVEELRNPG